MSDTIRELVDSFNSKEKIDWGLLGVIADALREEGNDVFADYLQACSSEQLCGFPYNSIRYSNLLDARSEVLRTAVFIWDNTRSFVKFYASETLFIQYFQRYYDKTLGLIVNKELVSSDLYRLTRHRSKWTNYLIKLMESFYG